MDCFGSGTRKLLGVSFVGGSREVKFRDRISAISAPFS
jgi:hypothetical protein